MSGGTKNRVFRSRDQPAEAGEECSISWLQAKVRHPPLKDGHLVTGHDDFDAEIGHVRRLQEEDLHGSEERLGRGTIGRQTIFTVLSTQEIFPAAFCDATTRAF